MIWGVFYKDPNRFVSESELAIMTGHIGRTESGLRQWICGNFGFITKDQFQGECNVVNEPVCLAFQGALTNTAELSKSLKLRDGAGFASLLVEAYTQWGEMFVEKIDGKFIFCLADHRQNLFLLGRDRFGIEPLYYYEDQGKVVFGSQLRQVVGHPHVPKELNFEAMHQFLLFCYNPTLDSFFKQVQKLRQSHVLIFRKRQTEIRRYWSLSFAQIASKNEADLSRELFELLNVSVGACLDSNRKTGVFVSGGMDSSSVAALACKQSKETIQTFSYRCQGESFDESPYAKMVSDYFKTKHSLVEYTPETVDLTSEVVQTMDEPFCDVGINLATHILGREAEGKISLVLTGDGGDELFGGHPVYLADRAANIIDRIPAVFTHPVFWLGSHLKDSDKKKDLRVKWKRFSKSIRFPASLLSHRWRIYYTPGEIQALLNPGILTQINILDPYGELLRFHAEADGKDLLSRSIYSDYQTVVQFYLRRMDLVRRFGIEPRFPLLNRRLVEFCGTLPSHLKIRKGSDVKAIFKRTMQNVLPKEIVSRKDKLGHSIPLKNWMRDNPFVKTRMLDLLSESSLSKRSYFDSKVVNRMIHEHLSKKENHSHRLWALMVLELWLRENLDR